MHWFYVATLFFSAFLLFLIQPMLAKALLPLVGGAPAVWMVAMLFFQFVLLAGYGYAAFGSRWLNPKRQSLLHLALGVIAALSSYPFVLQYWGSPETQQPEIWLLGTLLLTIGLPYFVLSAHSSLLQRWYHHALQREPYPLFSASNAGSMLGLFAYPLLVEWLLPLPQQMLYWGFAFAALILAVAVISWRLPAAKSLPETTVLATGLPWRLALKVMFLGFVPSSLFLGVTLYVTTDIASLPLLWIIPLALYLLSFILVFSRHGEWWTKNAQRLHLIAMVLAIIFIGIYATLWAILIHFLFFLVIALSCHGQAARLKPQPSGLTAYYFWLSLGGMLGGLFNTIAPYLFSWVMEYPLVLIVSIFALPSSFVKDGKITLPPAKQLLVIVATSICAGSILLQDPDKNIQSETLYQSRNFFGVSKVYRYPGYTEFMHGTTTHGIQAHHERFRLRPGSYYMQLDNLLQQIGPDFFKHPFGVVGLGAGTLACYGRAGQGVDFFEIDQAVIDIASDTALFTYLKDCPPKITIFKGDGRLELAKRPLQRYNLLVLDAFTSDAIPLHLLTREAIEMYIEHLVPESGILAFNLSNRHLALENFIAKAALELGWQSYYHVYNDDPEYPFDFGSSWLLVIPPESPWKEQILNARYRLVMPPEGTALWTDAYSNILPALKWRKHQ